jgi:20S proteasome alpha/beta subunit
MVASPERASLRSLRGTAIARWFMSETEGGYKIMTLVVALQGQDDLVFASDTLGLDGVKEGYYKFQARKLRVIGRNWVSGSSGTGTGADVQTQIEAAGESFAEDIDLGAPAYALRTLEVYRKSQYVGESNILLGGFNQHGPFLYRWSLPEFSGPTRCTAGRCAIGVSEHGAMHFAAAYHRPSMTTEQRMLLAYFCIYEVTKHDPRVGGAIDLAVVRQNGVQSFTADQLNPIRRECEALDGYISSRFLAERSERDPLLVG